MEDTLILEGKTFISSKRAARIAGYTTDYVGQLCRSEKINAKLLGRNWYVEENSIKNHKLRSRSTGKLSHTTKDNAKNLAGEKKRNDEIDTTIFIENNVPVYRPQYPCNTSRQLNIKTMEQNEGSGADHENDPSMVFAKKYEHFPKNEKDERTHVISIIKDGGSDALHKTVSQKYEIPESRSNVLHHETVAVAPSKVSIYKQTPRGFHEEKESAWKHAVVLLAILAILMTILVLVFLQGEVTYVR